MASAVEWVSRITAIAIEIVVLIWLGRWLDGKLGTAYWAPIGLVIGPVLGFYHLLTITGVAHRQAAKRGERRERDGN